jgi:hypothetical protein
MYLKTSFAPSQRPCMIFVRLVRVLFADLRPNYGTPLRRGAISTISGKFILKTGKKSRACAAHMEVLWAGLDHRCRIDASLRRVMAVR